VGLAGCVVCDTEMRYDMSGEITQIHVINILFKFIKLLIYKKLYNIYYSNHMYTR